MTEQQAISKLVKWCNGEVGYHEGTGNWNKYADNPDVVKLIGWRPQNQAWCDTFTDAAFCECFGLKAASEMTYQPIGKGSAACRTSAAFFKNNGAFFYKPQVGDVIFFISGGGINHQGIVTAINGKTITTVEGNSSDMVSRRNYTIGSSQIAGYGRPKWSTVAENATVGNQSEKPTSSEVAVSDSGNPNNCEATERLPVLRKGMTGESVRAAQMLLNGRDCYVGRDGCDGDFGNNTRSAVLAFQRRNGLEADGIIGAQTWAALLGVAE